MLKWGQVYVDCLFQRQCIFHLMQNQWFTWSCVYNKENFNQICKEIWQILRMLPYVSNTRWHAIFEKLFDEIKNIKDGKGELYSEKLRKVLPKLTVTFFVSCSRAPQTEFLFVLKMRILKNL